LATRKKNSAAGWSTRHPEKKIGGWVVGHLARKKVDRQPSWRAGRRATRQQPTVTLVGKGHGAASSSATDVQVDRIDHPAGVGQLGHPEKKIGGWVVDHLARKKSWGGWPSEKKNSAVEWPTSPSRKKKLERQLARAQVGHPTSAPESSKTHTIYKRMHACSSSA